MLRKDLFFHLIRNKKSYDYKFNHNLNDYKNNVKNNSLDTLILFEVENENDVLLNEIWSYKRIQSVSNHPKFDHKDTIAPGKFQIRCFVEKRKYFNQPHGIINAIDIEHQPIGEFSMQVEEGFQKGRWLIHDTYSISKGRDLYNAYSGGCFIFHNSNVYKDFNSFLALECKIETGDIIGGELIEV